MADRPQALSGRRIVARASADEGACAGWITATSAGSGTEGALITAKRIIEIVAVPDRRAGALAPIAYSSAGSEGNAPAGHLPGSTTGGTFRRSRIGTSAGGADGTGASTGEPAAPAAPVRWSSSARASRC